jgi:hypothetical protein
MKINQIVLSLVHNSAAALIVAAAPTVTALATDGPSAFSGNAAAYLTAHPLLSLGLGIAFMVARDALKNVPAFADASGTVSPSSPSSKG